jgi:hypothetical protein
VRRSCARGSPPGDSARAWRAVAGTPSGDVLDQLRYPYRTRDGRQTRNEGGEWHLEGASRWAVFPIVDKVGELIGVRGRKITNRTNGEKLLTNGHGGICAAKRWWRLTRVHDMVTSHSQPSRKEVTIRTCQIEPTGVLVQTLLTCGSAIDFQYRRSWHKR